MNIFYNHIVNIWLIPMTKSVKNLSCTNVVDAQVASQITKGDKLKSAYQMKID